ncbi:MotE family protein [Paenibacillus abyssi]|uniref:MgtE protein n=1 Tax=Paenibacillus abyssi TaxID=1340531 RepID=A0A917FVJ1_9BACL|nr:MgtE protein [Paenibacillus abyssi]GGG12397.1 hypothetical protein GCM10010916_31580 [Paenibacillus abyssi]
MADLEEERSYSRFERFMFFVTPILFTLVLLGVLLILFNVDLRNKALEIGNQIPIIGSMLPDAPGAQNELSEEALRSTNTSKRITELEALLASKEAELSQATADSTKQDQLIADLEGQVEQLQRINDEKLLDDEEYTSHIQNLAAMYAQITPSKAAPIMQSMEMEEMVLILNAMRPENRVRILERMNPKTAADATILMKDITSAKDQQIAALQARVNRMQSATAVEAAVLDEAQLNATFSSMPAASAADLLLKMAEVSQSKVLRILNAVDSAPRSQILAEMSAQNEDLTARLVSNLMN